MFNMNSMGREWRKAFRAVWPRVRTRGWSPISGGCIVHLQDGREVQMSRRAADEPIIVTSADDLDLLRTAQEMAKEMFS